MKSGKKTKPCTIFLGDLFSRQSSELEKIGLVTVLSFDPFPSVPTDGSAEMQRNWPPSNFLFQLSFQRHSCHHITKHYKICYLGKFQRFWFDGCKDMAHSDLRNLYGKSQQSLNSLAFMFSPEFKCLCRLFVK